MTTADEAQVRLLLQQWATATRKGRRNDVLANYLSDVLIYDVLAPMKYEGAAAWPCRGHQKPFPGSARPGS